MKNITVISTSMRNNSNSGMLAEELARGAAEKGHNVEFISLIDKNIKFCKGCLACQKLHHCVINDDANPIVEKILNSDIVVFATPVYYYDMSGQMKTLLDRGNSMFSSDYKFREVYLIAAAADNDVNAVAGTLNSLNGWISCFPKAELKSVVFARGAENPGDVKNMPVMQEAYNLGKSL